jgi:hypothetical protein
MGSAAGSKATDRGDKELRGSRSHGLALHIPAHVWTQTPPATKNKNTKQCKIYQHTYGPKRPPPPPKPKKDAIAGDAQTQSQTGS